MSDRPLRPDTDRSLGKPLPYQLANLPQAPPQADCSFNNCHLAVPLHYAVLAVVSDCYSPLEGRLLTCYSPVRHSMHSPKRALIVRLACLRHAASVDSEPGSNSRSFPSSFNVRNSSDVLVLAEAKPSIVRYLRINTWTYISSFQISTFNFAPTFGAKLLSIQ